MDGRFSLRLLHDFGSNLVAKGVGDFDEEQVWRCEKEAVPRHVARELMSIFADEPFDGYARVDDELHLSRSARMNKVLSS
jgi:hypothetical protein